jgi:hypothetical protein
MRGSSLFFHSITSVLRGIGALLNILGPFCGVEDSFSVLLFLGRKEIKGYHGKEKQLYRARAGDFHGAGGLWSLAVSRRQNDWL